MRDRLVRLEVTLTPALPYTPVEVHTVEGDPAFMVETLDAELVNPRLIEAKITFPVEAAERVQKVTNPWTEAAPC